MADNGKSDSGKKDPPYPGESPTGPEFDTWEKAFSNLLKGTDYPAGIQGKTPPSLIGISEPLLMGDMDEQSAVAQESTSETRSRVTFNLKLRQAKLAEASRKVAYNAQYLKLQNALAGRIISMLTDGKAPGLLMKMKKDHMIGAKENDTHDGFAMYRALSKARAGKDGPTAKREGQWYESKYQEILTDQLPDHCSVQSYSTKITYLRDELIPHFRTVKLDGTMLSEIIVQMMPLMNQSEGRVLEREMKKAKTYDDPDAVLMACTEIVSGSADTLIENARREAGSMPEGAPRLAALAAAAAMTPGGAATPATTGASRRAAAASAASATATNDVNEAKRKAAEAAATALAAAVKRAEKGHERESRLLPPGEWCHKGTCRFPHGNQVPCTSDPDWEGPLPEPIEKDAAHVERIENRRKACAKRLHEEGKRSTPNPKKLKKRSVAKPGGAATRASIEDDDPAGDGMGRLSFIGEPGFTSAFPATLGALEGVEDEVEVYEHVDMCQELSDDDDDVPGEWYMLSRQSDTGVGSTHSKYLIQNAVEMSALRTLYDTFESASLTNFGWGAEGAAAMDSALMMMVREPMSTTNHVADQAAAWRAELEQEHAPADGVVWSRPGSVEAQREFEQDTDTEEDPPRPAAVLHGATSANVVDTGASMHHDPYRDTGTGDVPSWYGCGGWAPTDPAASSAVEGDTVPTLKFFVVWGGPNEGVHGIFDMATELTPLISTPGSEAYGAANGVTTKELAEAKLLAMQRARTAQQWRNSPAPNRWSRNRPASSPEEVAQGMPCIMTYPQARQAIASLTPTSPIREIRHVIEAAGMPVSTAVGGGVRYFGPGPGKKAIRSRTRADILAEARGCLGMSIPPEWNNGAPIDRVQQAIADAEIGEESGDDAVTRRAATSPLTLIDDMPIMTEKQVAGIAISLCILFATIALVLATGVPIGPLCLAVVTYFGRASGAVSGLRMVADAPADQTGLVTHSELDWARSTDAGAIFAATTAMMTIIMLILHLLTEIGMLRGVITTLRWIIAAQSRVCRSLMRGLYQLPTQIRIVMTAVGTSAIIVIMFFLVRGTDGKMTEVKVARARNVVVKMPSAMRSVAMEVTKEQHNLTFQGAGDYLQGNDTIRLAGDLGIPAFLTLKGVKMNVDELDATQEAAAFEAGSVSAPRLNLLDTGAAIDTSDGTVEKDGGYAVAGTRGANTVAVSTANGTVVPPEHVTNRIPCRRRNGTVYHLVRPRALIMENCPHTLISVGTLCAQDGFGFWVGPYASESYLRPTGDPGDDIPFINVGVAILPDVHTPCMPTVARGQRGAAKFDAETVHHTFNARSPDVLKHLPECTPDAPSVWSGMTGGACDPCETAKAKRVPLTGSAGMQFDANNTVALDDWEVSVGHIHGGQRIVGGYHHNGSGVNRFYLKKTKSGAETAKCTNLFFTWMRNVCMYPIRHLHGDNAPNLIKGENEKMCERWGVHITSCAPYEPRGNSTIERPWRTFGEDIRSALAHANLTNCESLWWYAGRDANQKDWCIPRRCKKGKEINGRKWTTKWELLTGHRPRVTQHYPFGCLCYMLTYHPDSKVAQRGVRCLNFGRAEGQPGYLCFDGSRLWVSPHCSMVPGCFPGLTRKSGGGLMVSEPKLGTNYSETPPTAPHDNDEGPTDDGEGPTDGPGDGGVGRADVGIGTNPPPTVRIDDEDEDDIDGDDDDDDDDEDDGAQRISQRLGRRNRGVRFTEQGSGDTVPGAPASRPVNMPPDWPTPPTTPRGPAPTAPRPPDTPAPGNASAATAACHRLGIDAKLATESGGEFIIYIGSGRDRTGSVREHAAKGNLTVVMIDKKVGGYEHDIAYAPVVAALVDLVHLSNCKGVFGSIPCGTWSVLRYVRPGPPVLRRLASAVNKWVDETLGIKRTDGTLPDSVVNANLMVEGMVTVANAALESGKLFAYESPVSRAHTSQFAVQEREDHTEMSSHPALASLIERYGLVRTYFDQCMIGSDFEKKTQIIADNRTTIKVRAEFGTRVCDGSHEHRSMVGDVNENGTFASEDAAAYSSEMNELIAKVFIDTKMPTMSVTSPMADWSAWMTSTSLMNVTEEVTQHEFDRAYAPDPYEHAKAALSAMPTGWRETMQWSGIDGQAFPLQAEEYAGDNPSYNQSLHGPDKKAWAEARRAEMDNLHNHCAYDEIVEDSLPSWDEKRGTATEVVNTLWVQVKKRGKDGKVVKCKGRCVYDGRAQKSKAAAQGKELYSYAPCGRPSTHKCQIASAVHHRRRHRTFDVIGAYLKGKFNDDEVVYARPPPGERTYTFRNGMKVAIVWMLKVPLYGEVDAGYIWNRTATHQLCEVQKWNQSEHDPGYFWKILADGTFMDLLLYVDDAYVTDSGSLLADAEIEAFGMAFADHNGESGIKVQEPDYFLGANVDVNSKGSVKVSSKAYTQQMAAKYLPKPLEEYPKYHTPCAKDLVEAYDEARDRVGLLDADGQAAYASKCGAGIFAGPCSRFDALYTLGMCSRCLTFPTERMMKAIERCIVYMAQTCDRGIEFDDKSPLVYEAYSDADWQVAHSTTGTCHCIGGRVVHASSKRQQSISISTTEAEIMAASLAATEIVFMRSLLAEMGHDMSQPTVLWVDNMGAVEITKRRESLARSRHIERRYLKMQEWVAEGKIQVKYIKTDENRADMFTKPLDRATFEYHAAGIMGW